MAPYLLKTNTKMTINLLPSEEKAKIRKDKQAMAPLIQMTGPVEAEKKAKPAVQGGGVLGFFKQAFRAPKKVTVEDEKRAAEKKIIISERVTFEKPKEKVSPRIEFTKSIPPRPAPAASPSKPGFMARLFAPRQAKPIQVEKKIIFSGQQAEQFPKYTPVKTEEIVPQVNKKPRPVEIVELTTREFGPDKAVQKESNVFTKTKQPIHIASGVANGLPKSLSQPVKMKKEETHEEVLKSKGPSVWERFSLWFKKLFAREPKEKRADKPVTPVVEPAHLKIESTSPVFRHTPSLSPEHIEQGSLEQKPLSRPTGNNLVSPRPIFSVSPPAAPKEKSSEKVSPQREVTPTVPVQLESEKKKEQPSPLWQLGRNKKTNTAFTQPVEPVTKPFGMDWEVNLVPEEALEREVPVSKILYLVLAVIIAAAAVFGSWLAVNWYYNNKTKELNEVNSQIASVDTTIRSYKQLEDNVKSLGARLDAVRTMLDKHVSWSQLFSKLERYTIPETYYTNMTADVNGTISLSAVAKDYESAVKQLYVFQQASDFVSSASIANMSFVKQTTSETATNTNTSVSAAGQRVAYSISLSVLPSLFYLTQN